jgi:hypothetical protein
MSIAVALLVCLAGAVVVICSSPPPQRYRDLGLYAYAVGLFWVLASVSQHVVRFGP